MGDSIPQKIKSPEELKKSYELYCFKSNLLKEQRSEINRYVSFLHDEEKWTLDDISKLLNVSIVTIWRMKGGVK